MAHSLIYTCLEVWLEVKPRFGCGTAPYKLLLLLLLLLIYYYYYYFYNNNNNNNIIIIIIGWSVDAFF